MVDLRPAYTADSRRGFRREDERDETVTLHKFGDVSVAGVPFFVMDPAKVRKRRESDRVEGWARPGEPLGRFPAARRNPDVSHRGKPALPRRCRRVGLADGRRRHARYAGDEGRRLFCRRHERRARPEERRALRRHLRPGGSAVEHGRRRLYTPRAIAVLRVESRQEGCAVEDCAGELRHRYRARHRGHHRWRGAGAGKPRSTRPRQAQGVRAVETSLEPRAPSPGLARVRRSQRARLRRKVGAATLPCPRRSRSSGRPAKRRSSSSVAAARTISGGSSAAPTAPPSRPPDSA